eukprot:4618149-Amphidinium_carterae.1
MPIVAEMGALHPSALVRRALQHVVLEVPRLQKMLWRECMYACGSVRARPAGSGVVHFFSGIRHHLVDNLVSMHEYSFQFGWRDASFNYLVLTLGSDVWRTGAVLQLATRILQHASIVTYLEIGRCLTASSAVLTLAAEWYCKRQTF